MPLSRHPLRIPLPPFFKGGVKEARLLKTLYGLLISEPLRK